ncbi:hypothetical protein V491_07098 [Pseudogymnoascus sp. VKM F-3775]|nr:hypothetical protein V491_07098 [Pseudogymnoascus sp. VKM F-3775]
MSGAEAAFVVSLISGVISIIEATKTIYDAAKDAKGQPEAFRQVHARLVLVAEILTGAREKVKEVDKTTQDALKPILKSCKMRAENLNEIFQEVIQKEDDKWYDRYKKALSTLGKENKVECLMEKILKDVQVLVRERLTGSASDGQLKEIQEAIKEMSEMPSSFQEETGGVAQTHSGSGDNIGHSGSGSIYARNAHHNQNAGNVTYDYGSNSNNPTFIFKSMSKYFLGISSEMYRGPANDRSREDKRRIEDKNGGLLKDSYRWILEHSVFQQWRDDKQGRMLWIKGDPGKGKTMLLCGIVNELSPLTKLSDEKATTLLSYFFCQATDSRINNATSVLRGLIYLLIVQQPSLASHVRRKYNQGAKMPFEGVNSWAALSMIFEDILQDSSLKSTYLIIDALDECETGLPGLLKLIVQSASKSPLVKWLVSSRNKPDIEARLRLNDTQVRLSLELNSKHVSHAVSIFIDYKVPQLPCIVKDKMLQKKVRDQLYAKANGTFLWAALVLKELEQVDSYYVLKVLEEIPSELEPLYARMMRHVQQLQRDDPKFCYSVLCTMTLAYAPLHPLEVGALSDLHPEISINLDHIITVINKCGSFLTIRKDTVSFVHQSAKDYLLKNASNIIFPSGKEEAHYDLFLRSLQVMSSTLRRDVYSLRAPGISINMVEQPNPDPLAAARYPCLYWVDHLLNYNTTVNASSALQDGGSVDKFLRQNYLYWLEALSLIRSLPSAIVMINNLENILKVKFPILSYKLVRVS